MGPDTLRDRGGGSLEGGYFCLAQHLSELGHTLGSDAVALETVSEEQSIHGERAGAPIGPDTQRGRGSNMS